MRYSSAQTLITAVLAFGSATLAYPLDSSLEPIVARSVPSNQSLDFLVPRHANLDFGTDFYARDLYARDLYDT